MTVSTSTGREQTVGQIWLDAYQLAALYEVTQSLRTADKQRAARFSERIVDSLAMYNVTARQRTFADVTLTSGTYRYSMASTVLDVIGDGQYIKAGTADLTKASGETAVIQKDIETWQRVSAKNATGTPSIYFANRVATTVAVWYWPIPTEAGTVRHMVQRHLADMNDETATLDLENHWLEYVVYKLAHRLAEANSVPGTKIDRLATEAATLLQAARAFSNQHVDNCFYYDHRVA